MAKVLKKLEHWSCSGVLPELEMIDVLLEVISLIGMKPAAGRAHAYWSYPDDDGGGGVGYTIIQPLTESFISADVYLEDIDGQPVNQTEIILASCRECDAEAVGELLSRLVGPLIK